MLEKKKVTPVVRTCLHNVYIVIIIIFFLLVLLSLIERILGEPDEKSLKYAKPTFVTSFLFALNFLFDHQKKKTNMEKSLNSFVEPRSAALDRN